MVVRKASSVLLGGEEGAGRPLLRRLWGMFSGGDAGDPAGGRRHLPTLWDLLGWLDELELADDPFPIDDLRVRTAEAAGLDVTVTTAREKLRGRVDNPEGVYQLLKGNLQREGGITGAMIRDPLTESAQIMLPGDLKPEEAMKSFAHEVLHVALGDPVPVNPRAPFPEEATRKIRRGTGAGGVEQLYWIPEKRAFGAPVLLDHAACEQRAEVLAEYALLASLHGGEALRELDDHFWT